MYRLRFSEAKLICRRCFNKSNSFFFSFLKNRRALILGSIVGAVIVLQPDPVPLSFLYLRSMKDVLYRAPNTIIAYALNHTFNTTAMIKKYIFYLRQAAAYDEDFMQTYCNFENVPFFSKEELRLTLDAHHAQIYEDAHKAPSQKQIIPRIIHTIYIHDAAKNSLSNEERIEIFQQYIKQYENFPKDIKKVLWCDDISVFLNILPEKLQQQFKEASIEIREIPKQEHPLKSYIYQHQLWKSLEQLYVLNILYKEGGYYAALGVYITPQLFDELHASDHAFIFGKGGIEYAFMAALPQSPIIKKVLHFYDRFQTEELLKKLNTAVKVLLYNPSKQINFFLQDALQYNTFIDIVHNKKSRSIFLLSKSKNLNTQKAANIFLSRMLNYPLPPSFFKKDHPDSLVNLHIDYENDPLFRFNPETYQYFSGKLKTEAEWLALPSGITTEKKPKELIVSMTSWPPRMAYAWLAIESMMQQTLKPDRIILHLAEEEFPDHKIPHVLEQLKKRGLEVRFGHNHFGGKKFLNLTEEEHKNHTIVIVDDDYWYDPTLLEDLWNAHLKDPKTILGINGSVQRVIKGKMAHYIDSPTFSYHERAIISVRKIALAIPRLDISFDAIGDKNYELMPIGNCGILYPPDSLDARVFDRELYLKLCAKNDDVWFWVMAILKGTRTKLIRARGGFPNAVDTKGAAALWNTDNRNGHLTTKDRDRLIDYFKLQDFFGITDQFKE